MNPLSIIAGVAGIGEVALSLSKTLYGFVQDTREVDQTVADLAAETQALGDTCVNVHEQLKDVVLQYEAVQPGQKPGLWTTMESRLEQCRTTINKLDAIVKPVKQNKRTFPGQALRQFKLKMSHSDMTKVRNRIVSHTTALQITLQIVNITVSHLAPKQADQALLTKLDALQQTVDVLVTQGQSSSASQQARDAALLQQAEDVLSSGASLYESSVAGGSVIGGPGVGLQRQPSESIPEWIKSIQAFQSSQNAIAITHANDSSETLLPTTLSVGKLGIDKNQTHTALDLVPGVANADSLQDTFASNTEDTKSGTSSDPEEGAGSIEWEDEFEINIANQALELARDAISKAEYQTAHEYLQVALGKLGEVSQQRRELCHPREIHYLTAFCAFHIRDPPEAETALVAFLDRPEAITRDDSLRLCNAGHMLSLTYVRVGKLDLARSTCLATSRGRWKILGASDTAYFDSLALLSRIYSLQHDQPSAKLYQSMVPSDVRDGMIQVYSKEAPEPIPGWKRNQSHHSESELPRTVELPPVEPGASEVKSLATKDQRSIPKDTAFIFAEENKGPRLISKLAKERVNSNGHAKDNAVHTETVSPSARQAASSTPRPKSSEWRELRPASTGGSVAVEPVSISRNVMAEREAVESKRQVKQPQEEAKPAQREVSVAISRARRSQPLETTSGDSHSLVDSQSAAHDKGESLRQPPIAGHSLSDFFRRIKMKGRASSSAEEAMRNATLNDYRFVPKQEFERLVKFSRESSSKCEAMMEVLAQRLNPHSTERDQIYKALNVMKYLMIYGDERCLYWVRRNLHLPRSFFEYHFVVQGRYDYGAHIRQRAKEVYSMARDEERLKTERAKPMPLTLGTNTYLTTPTQSSNGPGLSRWDVATPRIDG